MACGWIDAGCVRKNGVWVIGQELDCLNEYKGWDGKQLI